LVDRVNLMRANLLLDRAIDASNDNESAVAGTILVNGLRAEGFRPGDVLLIGRESPIHEQFLQLTRDHVQLVRQLEELRAKNLELELARIDHLAGRPQESSYEQPIDEPIDEPSEVKKAKQTLEWTEPIQQMLIDDWLRGRSNKTIAKNLTSKLGVPVTANMVTGQLVNGVPPAFLDVRIAAIGEPTSWLELWLLGSILYRSTVGTHRNRGWRKILTTLELKSGTGPPIDPNLLDIQEGVDRLRTQAIDWQAN
jgi:hypothetical protein